MAALANCLAPPNNTDLFFARIIMGRLRRSRVHNARRDVHRASRTRVSLLIYAKKTLANEYLGQD